MSAAATTPGVWEHVITDKLYVIIDTDKNQIIKMDDGIPTVYQYPIRPTTGMINCFIEVTTLSNSIIKRLEIERAKINARKNNPLIDTDNDLKDKVIDYLNKEFVLFIDDELQGVLDILGIERSETEFKWERI